MPPNVLKAYPKLYSWIESLIRLTTPKSVSVFLEPMRDDEKYTRLFVDKKILQPLKHPPKIFQINWFRKNHKGYVWPGFAENIRVLKWIFERCDHQHKGTKKNYGFIPQEQELDLAGLNVNFQDLFEIDPAVQSEEKKRHKEFLTYLQ